MKILVVDDHPLIQEALRQVLKELDDRLDLLQAGDRAEAVSALERHPDTSLLLLDLALPGASGLDLLNELREAHPGIPVVVLSATHDRDTVTRAIDAGAMGFIPKTSSPKVLVSALKLVLSGGVYLPTNVLGAGAEDPAQMATPSAVLPSSLGLTPRQAEVLALMVQGKPNKLICRALNLSEGTVKVHVSAVLRALNVSNRTQAVIQVSRMGVRFDIPRPRPG